MAAPPTPPDTVTWWGIGGQPARRAPFDWLQDPYNRRSGLRDVEAAIRSGRLDAAPQATRDALCAVLAALAADPTLKAREVCRVARCVLAIDARTIP